VLALPALLLETGAVTASAAFSLYCFTGANVRVGRRVSFIGTVCDAEGCPRRSSYGDTQCKCVPWLTPDSLSAYHRARSLHDLHTPLPQEQAKFMKLEKSILNPSERQ